MARIAPTFIAAGSATCLNSPSQAARYPSGILEDDILIAYVWTASASSNFTGPAGWTKELQTNAGGTIAIFSKIADGTEVALAYDYFPTGAGTLEGGGGMICLRGGDLTQIIDPGNVSNQTSGSGLSDDDKMTVGTGASPAMPAHQTFYENTLLIACAGSNDNNSHGGLPGYTIRAQAVGVSGFPDQSISVCTASTTGAASATAAAGGYVISGADAGIGVRFGISSGEPQPPLDLTADAQAVTSATARLRTKDFDAPPGPQRRREFVYLYGLDGVKKGVLS